MEEKYCFWCDHLLLEIKDREYICVNCGWIFITKRKTKDLMDICPDCVARGK